ncbi:MAG: M20/M25/M40 family metallo-hydrolase [Gemmataceae bacterium]
MPITLDHDAATKRLLKFLSVDGITGQEAAISKVIIAALKDAGLSPKAIRFDDANSRIPVPTQTGNLIATLPGTKKNAKPLLFMTHMDTVPLCAGAKPKLDGRRIVNTAHTALGGDNRTGCAVLVSMVAELIRQKHSHGPITLLFTVREESGLFGAKHLNPADLGPVEMGFNVDSRLASDLVIGAIGAERWEVDIFGQASHAGVAPEKGISATMVNSLAMADVFAEGWFGKVSKDSKAGTSNVGSVSSGEGKPAGDATNVVTDFVHVTGESRSHDARFVRRITSAYKTAYESAAKRVKDHEGKTAKVKFTSRLDYLPFRMKDSDPVVKYASSAVKHIGLTPNLKVTNGGLDANWMVKHGIPTVTFGAGQNEIHTVKEFVDLNEFDNGCRLALALATM